MLSLETIPAVVYTDPWVLPLTERLRMLAAGRTRVAYFYERADNSTFRYRIYNMVQVINSANLGISASYFFLDDLRLYFSSCLLLLNLYLDGGVLFHGQN